MTIQKYTFNPFQTNMYVADDGGEAVIVDASAYLDEDFQLIRQYVEDNRLHVAELLLTHAHIDHILGCKKLSDIFGLPWKLNSGDRPLIDQAAQQAILFGIEIDEGEIPTEALQEGDAIAFGGVSLNTLLTPGHSPGSVSFADSKNGVVFSGDVLFQGSIGRTDLWQGSLPILMRSIFQKIIPLGDDFRVCCGHGPDTTVGEERRTNPFLQEGAIQVR